MAAPCFGVRARPTEDGSIVVMGTDPGSPAEAIGLLAELSKPGVELTVERNGETIPLKRKE